MTWGCWYAAKSYTMWLSPLVAFVLAQLTYRLPYVLGVDLGAIPGFILMRSQAPPEREDRRAINLNGLVRHAGNLGQLPSGSS